MPGRSPTSGRLPTTNGNSRATSLPDRLPVCRPSATSPTTSWRRSPVSVNSFSVPTSFCMSIDPRDDFGTRREFLTRSAFGIGAFALAHLLNHDELLAEVPGKPGENLAMDLRP